MASLAGATGAVRQWSLPLPAFDWTDPSLLAVGHLLALILLPATYVVCLIAGMGEGWIRPSRHARRQRLMAATGIMGLGLLPQALHRTDVQHLLQVLPPMLLAVPLLARRVSEGARTAVGSLAIGCYVGALLVAAVALAPSARADLVVLDAHPVARLRELQRGIAALPSHPLVEAIMATRAATSPDERVLVVPLVCQFSYFAERRLSGLVVGYAQGVHDDDEWRARNFRAVQRHPPAVVIATEPLAAMPAEDPFRVAQPELYAYLRARYERVLYQHDGWTVLAPSGG
jgi:hypothetical protein